jgi:hypothetical protein
MLFGFHRIVLLDTEFGTAPDGSPRPICAVLRTLPDRQLYRLWLLGWRRWPPLPFSLRDPNTVCIAYSIPAEVSVLLKLQEPLPTHWVDLFAEYRAIRNGHGNPKESAKLLDVLAHYQEFSIDAEEKDHWQQMALRYDRAELEANKEGMLDYCQADTDALLALVENPHLQADLAQFHREEVLFRGRSQVARARVVGLPVDGPLVRKIQKHRLAARLAITRQAQARHGWGAPDDQGAWRPLFDDTGMWNQATYERWLKHLNIKLPKSPKSGQVRKKLDMLTDYEVKHPELSPLRRTLHLRQLLQNFRVPVNDADRSVWFANPFGSITGRDQPSSAANLFGLPKMFRQMMRPAKGHSLAYLDVSAEEVWIFARASGSVAMEEAYRQDIYVQSLRKAGWSPEAAAADRNKRGKPYVLAVGYGQSSYGLAPRLEISEEAAAELIWRHRYRNFPEGNRFQRGIVNGAQRRRKTYFTPLGFPYWTGKLRSVRSMLNFPMQAGGSDYMRVVLVATTEAGLRLCCLAHDGFMIEARTSEIETAIATMLVIMRAAGIALYGSAPIVKCEQRVDYPNSFDPGLNQEEREIWATILQTLAELDAQEAA